MRGLLADNNVVTHVRILCGILATELWREYWESLNLALETFASLDLADDASDAVVWKKCQDKELVLLTANRRSREADSLESVIRMLNKPTSLPVITIADPNLLLSSKTYAARAAERLLEFLLDMDNLRGTGRLYIP